MTNLQETNIVERLKYAVNNWDNLEYYEQEETIRVLNERYPWLIVRNRWTGEVIEYPDYNELFDIPGAWLRTFGIDFMEELLAVIPEDFKNNYRITQIKEKYGSLRWYDNGHTEAMYRVIRKYEGLSQFICQHCGAPATLMSTGYYLPVCNNCAPVNCVTLAGWHGIDDVDMDDDDRRHRAWFYEMLELAQKYTKN